MATIPGWSRRPAASASRCARVGSPRPAAGITLTATGRCEALVGGGEDRAEAAGAEPRPEPVAAEDELGADFRGQLVRGVHQTCVRRRAAVPSEGAVILGRPNGLRRPRTLSFFDEDDEPQRTTRTRVRPHRPRAAAGWSAADPATVRPCWSGAWSPCIVGALLLLAAGLRGPRVQQQPPQGRAAQLQPAGLRHRHRVAPDRPAVLRGDEPGRRAGAGGPLWAGRRVQELGRQVARAGARPGRAGRHGVGPAVAADRARAAARRADEDRRGRQDRARRRGRGGRQGDRQRSRGRCRRSTRRTCCTTPRDPVHHARSCRTPSVGTDIQVQQSQFMRDINWVSPQFVASKLGQQLSGGGDGDGESRRRRADRAGPARHRPGRDVLRPDDPAARARTGSHTWPARRSRSRSPTRATTTSSTSRSRSRSSERAADRRSRSLRPCSAWPRARRRR